LVEGKKMNFVDVCALEDVALNSARPARVGGKDVALFNVAGSIHALENSCPHQGAALTGGKLCGRLVSCPAHGLRFDVTTGAMAGGPSLTVKKFSVKIDGDRILVDVGA
jgi:nitrite reductase/ring-hydroxylating ferredoxin subunit